MWYSTELYQLCCTFPFLSFIIQFIRSIYYFYSKETLKVLEINDKNKSKVSGYWKNPKSGNEGVIKIKGYYGSPECRLIEHIYVESSLIGRGKSNNVFDAACREESGQWAMIR